MKEHKITKPEYKSSMTFHCWMPIDVSRRIRCGFVGFRAARQLWSRRIVVEKRLRRIRSRVLESWGGWLVSKPLRLRISQNRNHDYGVYVQGHSIGPSRTRPIHEGPSGGHRSSAAGTLEISRATCCSTTVVCAGRRLVGVARFFSSRTEKTSRRSRVVVRKVTHLIRLSSA